MINVVRKSVNLLAATKTAVALTLVLAMPIGAKADEAAAKKLVKAMSDYVAAQKVISFDYDVSLEVVTTDDQKLTLAASGNVELARPDKVRASRSGGFADIETVFDGRTLTILGENMNVYTQVAIPGSIDHLVDELRGKYHRPLPGADLLISNSYDELMEDVVDVKDLGSGVIGGTECDHFAFRKKDVDWQIWIAQGSRPHPCRYRHRDQGRGWQSRGTAFRSTTGKLAATSRRAGSASSRLREPVRWMRLIWRSSRT